VRRADEDGNVLTVADRNGTPFCAPASNRMGKDFTPNFPAYSSGPAAFGAVLIRTKLRAVVFILASIGNLMGIRVCDREPPSAITLKIRFLNVTDRQSD
jgi:hypothetical protein